MAKDKKMEEFENVKEENSIPSLRIYYNQTSDLKELFSSENSKEFIYDMLIDSIERGVERGLDEIEIFNIENYDSILMLKRDQFKYPLEVMLKYYESKEEYIKCADINKLLKKL